MKIMVTGDKGFVGQWLVKELESQGHEISGYDIKDGLDITKPNQLGNYIAKHGPEQIYHLAAIASVPQSIEYPRATVMVNVVGSINLLRAAKGRKVLLASTGHAETNSSPYTVSKLAMEGFGKLYPTVVITRAHNHAGPGQSDEYAVSSFAKQIAMIEKGNKDGISHGDLGSVRNYTDVRDVVWAYTCLMGGPPGSYEVASDNNTTMRSIVNTLCGMATVPIVLMEDDELSRPATSFTTDGVWGRIPWEQSLEDTLNYWRERV